MDFFDELSKETNDIFLVDTNVLINLEKKECSTIDNKAVINIINQDIKPFLTDLSFCELIAGCRNINDYNFHCKNICDMEFLLCGFYKPLCDYLSSIDYNNYNNIFSDDEFDTFKSKQFT